jgi:hypothetical protein
VEAAVAAVVAVVAVAAEEGMAALGVVADCRLRLRSRKARRSR